MNDDSLLTAANWAQILSVVVALIATAVTVYLSIWIYRRSQQKRALTCFFDEIFSPIDIKAGDALKGDIEIRYKTRPVNNLFVVRAILKNTGNTPLRNNEVVDPVTFYFSENTELVKDPQVLKANPENLMVKWTLLRSQSSSEWNSARMEFALLNPGDSLTVEFLCTGIADKPKVLARIEGMPSIEIVELTDTKIQLSPELLNNSINSMVHISVAMLLVMALTSVLAALNISLLPLPLIAGVVLLILDFTLIGRGFNLIFITRPRRPKS